MTELTWIAKGRKHIGLREIKGAKHNPTLYPFNRMSGNFFNFSNSNTTAKF